MMAVQPQVRWQGVVVRIGPEAEEFIQAGMLVLFGEQAPPELQAVSVVHRTEVWNGPCSSGDILRVNGRPYPITAVGDGANERLRELGHAVIKFNGRKEPELPGDLCVVAAPVPSLEPGMVLSIEAGPQAPERSGRP
ncbi:MAG: PTS glucitol/sorbitol transporter subunit IIA [Firmicutes bacterium]|nr:PTS glucitol/sorbitol transporter subunit IIA [Bacillota bacterium]